MKKIVAIGAAVACGIVFNSSATVYTVNDVHSLTNALATHKSAYDVIELEPGDYDLTGILMCSDDNLGGSHLYQVYTPMVGKGKTPWETRLIGDGTHRIIQTKNDWYYQHDLYGARIENICITNGYAKVYVDPVGGTNITSSGQGGGVYGYAVFTNSVIIGCRAETLGGASCPNLYASDSKFINNTADMQAGALYNPNWYRSCEFIGNRCDGTDGGAVACGSEYGTGKDSLFENNYSANRGGAITGTATVTNCIFRNNTAKGQGGAVYRGTPIKMYDCLVEGNTGNYGGGILGVALVSNCVIRGNVATIAGGGLCSWGDNCNTTYKVIDSVICSNECDTVGEAGYGGGLARYYAINCKVFDNCARHGGADERCVYDGCEIHHNYATGNSGGLYASIAFNSRIWDNVSNNSYNGYVSKFINCDISGVGIAGGMATGCVFHDIGREATVVNRFVTKSVSNTSVWVENPSATNCLFVNNRCATRGHDGSDLPAVYWNRLFVGTGTKACRIVNCTIVSNAVGQTFVAMSTTAPWVFENCVFKDNQYYWDYNSDIVQYDADYSNAVYFRNCAYGTASGRMATNGSLTDVFTYAGSENFRFGVNGVPATPRFDCEKNPASATPYMPRYNSPLYGTGAVESWMYTATDIAGNPRLRADKVDIGCYQSQQSKPGVTFIVK